MESTGKRGIVVALDGPGSSGKSSVGAAAAARVGYRFCDTGLFYRTVGWLALAEGVSLDDGAALAALVPRIHLELDDLGTYGRVLVDGCAAEPPLQGHAADRGASHAARQPRLREALVASQRDLVADGAIVMAGRDIGSVILPDADLKLYIDASVEERARRRIEERGLAAESAEAGRILEELRRRDHSDSRRAVAPLQVVADAVVIDTSGYAFEQTVDVVVRAIVERSRELGMPATDRGSGLPGGAGA